ncbi:MAG: DUF3352 domain-containing protein, partial [Symploca sp. SIO2B6]|nr:DUF3352 domain-containing protein [Symploca sp. SIO2B6]
AAFWMLRQQGESTDSRASSGYFSAIPQETLVTITLSTSGRQWQQIRSFGTLETQAAFNEQLAQLRDRFLESTGLDYQQDIQPWIGERITIALLPPDVDADGGDADSIPDPASTDDSEPSADDPVDTPEIVTEDGNATEEGGNTESAPDKTDGAIAPPGLDPELIDPTQNESPILIVPIADPLKARSLLQKALGDAEPITRDYQGLEIQELPREGDESYFTTVLDRQTLVLTTDDMVLEQVIDTHLGGPSIIDVPGYSSAMGKVTTTEPFMELYVNSAAAVAVAAANTIQAAPPQGLDALQNAQGVGATVVLNESGFAINGVAWLKEDTTDPYQLGKSTGHLLDKLPQDTLVVATGSNLKQLWDGIDQRAGEGIKGPLNPQSIRSGFQSMTDLDIDSDVIRWMTKDFALAFVAAPETEEAAPTAGVVFLAEADDRTAAEKTFAELDTVMGDRYQFQVNPKTLGGVEVTDWAAPFGSMTITRGWLEENTSFVTIGNISDHLVPKPSVSLANDPLFQQVIADDLRSINGYFFLNIEAILGAKSALPIPPLPPAQASIVGAVKAIGVTTAIPDEQTARFKVTVVTPTLENPGTLPEIVGEETDITPEGEEAEGEE